MQDELKDLKIMLFNDKMKQAHKELDKLNLTVEQKEKVMGTTSDSEFVNNILSSVYKFDLKTRKEMRQHIKNSTEFQIIKSNA